MYAGWLSDHVHSRKDGAEESGLYNGYLSYGVVLGIGQMTSGSHTTLMFQLGKTSLASASRQAFDGRIQIMAEPSGR